jgi:hypothetical protein
MELWDTFCQDDLCVGFFKLLFQRPYPVNAYDGCQWRRDGWWFVAFGYAFRVRGWRIRCWGPEN